MSQQLLDTPFNHPASLVTLADNALNLFREIVFKATWPSIARLAEAAVVGLLKNITAGHLQIVTISRTYTFPPIASPRSVNTVDIRPVKLHVLNDVFWVRLCTMGDLGFAEAFMFGDVQCDNLIALFEIFLLNRTKLQQLEFGLSTLFSLSQKMTSWRFLNTITNAKSNISAHYDISNEMFAAFLSKDMSYSCALFEDLDGDLRLKKSDPVVQSMTDGGPDDVLHTITNVASWNDKLAEAQLRKLKHLFAKCKILPNQRVLEIGSGWGFLSILLAQTFPKTTVDTLTLSVNQKEAVMARVNAAGLQDRVRVHLMDYRTMPAAWGGSFDRVISVEMLEAVGPEFLKQYWSVIDWALKPDSGVGVVQVITIPESRYSKYIREIDFIRKWSTLNTILQIFPGGSLPTLTMLIRTMEEGSSGRLVVDSVCNIGPHYARTLREWCGRFLDRFESDIAPALKKEHPDLAKKGDGEEEIQVFKRKWLYYFCYCEVGFASRILNDHIITFTREGAIEYGCNVYE